MDTNLFRKLSLKWVRESWSLWNSAREIKTNKQPVSWFTDFLVYRSTSYNFSSLLTMRLSGSNLSQQKNMFSGRITNKVGHIT